MPCDTLKNNKTLKPTVGCLLCSFALVFVFSITAFAFTQMQDDKASALRFADEAENEVDAEVVEIIVNEGGSQYGGLGAVKKFPQTNDTGKLLTTTIRQQQQHQHQNKREVGTNEDKQTDNNHTTINRGYYEEQRPVVVHAESLPTLGRRQDNFGAPPTNFQDPYYERPAAEYEADELEGASDDGGGEVGVDRRPYEQQRYYDDGDEDESAAGDNEYVPSEQQSASEGRAAQNSAYDSYYRQWHYATPAPVAMQRPNGGWEVGDNRKLQNGVR
ncbi:PREDICTED: uncharacterized protein LOC108371011, partial [Rhagoletis zephyria]|uniref:uncharacterized protein LOC108371011 n=1 Tax=Rhagoletis zephyria TaxID=28612 RepID=UPI0008117F8C